MTVSLPDVLREIAKIVSDWGAQSLGTMLSDRAAELSRPSAQAAEPDWLAHGDAIGKAISERGEESFTSRTIDGVQTRVVVASGGDEGKRHKEYFAKHGAALETSIQDAVSTLRRSASADGSGGQRPEGSQVKPEGLPSDQMNSSGECEPPKAGDGSSAVQQSAAETELVGSAPSPAASALGVCPFCIVGQPRVRRDTVAYLDKHAWFVLCKGCGACGPNTESAEKAIAAWNRRAPDTDPESELKSLKQFLAHVHLHLTNDEDFDADEFERDLRKLNAGEWIDTETLLIDLRAELAALKAGEKALREALLKLRSYNEDYALDRINYRPYDHIQVIDRALLSPSAKDGGQKP